MVRGDRRNCTEEQAKYSSPKFPLRARLILIYLGARSLELAPLDLFPVLARLPVLVKRKWPMSSRRGLVQIPNHTSSRTNPARGILARHVLGLASKCRQNFALVFTSHQEKCVE